MGMLRLIMNPRYPNQLYNFVDFQAPATKFHYITKIIILL